MVAMFNCLRNCLILPKWLRHFTITATVYEGSNVYILTNSCHYLTSSNFSHPSGCEVVSHCSLFFPTRLILRSCSSGRGNLNMPTVTLGWLVLLRLSFPVHTQQPRSPYWELIVFHNALGHKLLWMLIQSKCGSFEEIVFEVSVWYLFWPQEGSSHLF